MNFEIKYKKNNINWDELKLINIIENKNILFKKNYILLKETKDKIDSLDNCLEWDNFKKITNPFELVYIKNKNYNNSLTKYKPVSRSFFKLIEMDTKFNLTNNKNNLNIGCLAEAPGGFIEALYYRYNDKNLKINGISIYPSSNKIPTWHKLNHLIQSNNIRLDYGDLYNTDNIIKYLNKFEKKATLVTSDGGFDFSKNFNNQELDSHHIIFNEVMIATLILEKGGNFICKIFDIFNIFTVQIIYILNNLFEKIYLYKPNTSRTANSEKYIICKNFIGCDKKLYNVFFNLIKCINNNKKNKYIMLNIKIPNEFIHLLNIYNEKYVARQIYYLNQTLNIISNKIKDNIVYILKKEQITNAINWCFDNKMNINTKSIYYK